jgi:hypothetical protein
MFAQVGNLAHIRVQSRLGTSAAEGSLVHTWRARADDDTVEMMFSDSILYQALSRLGTHIFIIGSELHSFELARLLSDTLTVDSGADVLATMTYKNSYS